MLNSSKTTKLITIGLFIALEIILTRFLSINTPFLRIGFGFLPVAMLGIMYGPIWAGIAYAAGDVLGILIFPSGAFFPGFTLSAALTGIVYGLILYNKPITWKSSLIAASIVCIGINLFMDTYWLYILMDRAVIAMIPARIIKSVIMICIQTALIPLIWNKYLKNVIKYK
jgi:ECF transporter S component (folate family)